MKNREEYIKEVFIMRDNYIKKRTANRKTAVAVGAPVICAAIICTAALTSRIRKGEMPDGKAEELCSMVSGSGAAVKNTENNISAAPPTAEVLETAADESNQETAAAGESFAEGKHETSPSGEDQKEEHYTTDLSYFEGLLNDFSLKLFRETLKNEEYGKTVLISPVYTYSLLCGSTNGVSDPIYSQMQNALKFNTADESLNSSYKAFIDKLTTGGRGSLSAANIMWLNSSAFRSVNQSFTDRNADYYRSKVICCAADSSSKSEINGIINEKTGGRINSVLSGELPDGAMRLISAVSFNGNHLGVSSNEIDYCAAGSIDFTDISGKVKSVTAIQSDNAFAIKEENASGFIFDLNGGKYRLTAMMPNDGISVYDYAKEFCKKSAEEISGIGAFYGDSTIKAVMPSLDSVYEGSMKNAISAMGTGGIFSSSADFSKIGESSGATLSDLTQKCRFSLNTDSERPAPTKSHSDSETETVTINRPFIFMLTEKETGIPVLMGIIPQIN